MRFSSPALLALLVSSQALAANVLVGDFQSAVGCTNEDASCAATTLATRSHDGIESLELSLPAGSFSFRLALNEGAEGYVGANATVGGPAIPLTLASAQSVRFFFDPQTKWLTSSVTDELVTAAGSFQSELGCPGDWAPDCLRSWLQDPDGDGVFTFVTTAIPPGTHEVKAAHDLAWDESYGEGGSSAGGNISFTVSAAGAQVSFRYVLSTHILSVTVTDDSTFDLKRARAHWLSPEVIAWEVGGLSATTRFRLHASVEGGISATEAGVSSEATYNLTLDALPQALRDRFPHLAHLVALRLPPEAIAAARELVRGQLVVSASHVDGAVLEATSLQMAGALDELFPYDGPLGATFDGTGAPTVRVWAPTAKTVQLRRFSTGTSGPGSLVPMTRDAASGVWTVTGEPSWRNQFYIFELETYRRELGTVRMHRVTDPYGLSVSTNGTRTQFVDLNDPTLAPEGWATLDKPALAAIEDTVLYELHVRDFSIQDESVPEAHRGTFLAFTHPESVGMKHLARLAKAGVTHVHLLPAFDFATVNEDRSQHESPAGDLASLAPDSPLQQEAVAAVAAKDGFNWGYDPLHYTVPEGSYATDPDGTPRIVEFRRMVQGLASAGLRTVMDVVYNHTHAAGLTPGSVLDQIVPHYYQRLNADGDVERSTCCANTATEFAMMDRLVVDSVVTWAKVYKVDGFRFDLMGHHPKANLLRVRAALDALTLEKDGVDGSKIVLYGEGWDFGEVVNNSRFVNASQTNMAGTNIATFNDRFRDAVRGGTPFHGFHDQGFVTGLVSAHNGITPGTAGERRSRAYELSRVIQVGLTGALADYALDVNGRAVLGREVFHNGLVAGYAKSPLDVVTYVSAHDNETLFDGIQLKAPKSLPMDERVRMHNLATSLVALGQGLPFFHAGDELLRSKSLDRNSYDSGDWFNRIDWTGTTNAWGSGLPPQQDNGQHWETMAPLLADPALHPAPGHMQRALEHFEEVLMLRRSSPLFRSATAEQVKARVKFDELGPETLGMWLSGGDEQLLVVFNASADTVQVPRVPGLAYALHPVQLASTDPRVREVKTNEGAELAIPARTTLVLTTTPLEGLPPREPSEQPATGCGCASASGAAGALGLLVLVTRLLRRRRR